MTSVVTLSPPLQYLVDCRLDSIERLLFCTDISRLERREIVQSVEDQILELLGRRSEAEPSRDSLLAVLAMIDPPEAFLPADIVSHNRYQTLGGRRGDSTSASQRAPRISSLAIVSCVLGLISLVSFPLIPVSAIAGVVAVVSGSIALTQIHYSNRLLKGVWPSVVGVSSPAIAMIVLLVLIGL